MSAPQLATVQATDAHAAATRDRAAHAQMLLEVAVKDAVALIRAGEPGRAEFVLARAGMAAERILGPSRTPLRPFRGSGSFWRVAWLEGTKPCVEDFDTHHQEITRELRLLMAGHVPMVYEIPVEVTP